MCCQLDGCSAADRVELRYLCCMCSVRANCVNMVSGVPVISYTLYTMLHITPRHGDML